MSSTGGARQSLARFTAAVAVGGALYGLLRWLLGWHAYLAALVGLGAAYEVYRHALSSAGLIAGREGQLVSKSLTANLLPVGGVLVVHYGLRGLGWLPGAAVGVALLTGWLMWFLLHGLLFEDHSRTFQRGARVRTPDEAARLTAAARSRDGGDPQLPAPQWGGQTLPYDAGTAHFAVAGTTGSGKTVTIRLLLQSVLPAIGAGLGHRAIIYDDKQEYVQILAGLGLRCEPRLLNPFDKRCWAWDLARDVTEVAVCEEMAAILAPENPRLSQPFFDNAVRLLIRDVLVAFMLTVPGFDWELWDLVLAFQDQASLRRVLSLTPLTRRGLEMLDGRRESRNIMLTAQTLMRRYETVAAAWHRVPKDRRVSLTEWVHQEGILLLSNDPNIEEPLGAINQAMFKRLSQLLTVHSTGVTGRTWLLVDELREGKRLDGLTSILNKGRSQGVCVILGFQGIEGVQEVYGRELASEITSQCNHKALLRLPSDVSAEWASAQVGVAEYLELRRNWGTTESERNSSSSGVSEQLETRPAVLPAEFLQLPLLQAVGQMGGWYLTPYAGAYPWMASWAELAGRLQPLNEDEPIYDRRDPEDQLLAGWEPDDLRRLGLTAEPDAADEPPAPEPEEAPGRAPQPAAESPTAEELRPALVQEPPVEPPAPEATAPAPQAERPTPARPARRTREGRQPTKTPVRPAPPVAEPRPVPPPDEPPPAPPTKPERGPRGPRRQHGQERDRSDDRLDF